MLQKCKETYEVPQVELIDVAMERNIMSGDETIGDGGGDDI
jgi:hypothetical protein